MAKSVRRFVLIGLLAIALVFATGLAFAADEDPGTDIQGDTVAANESENDAETAIDRNNAVSENAETGGADDQDTPVNAEEPTDQETPADPDTPDSTADQDASADPDTPDSTEDQDTPADSDTQDEPSDADTPADSDDPDKTEDPDTPEEPSEPEEPETSAQIVYENGEFYFYDENGEMVKGCWIDFNGNRYFASPDGSFYRNRFIKFGSTRYYMGSDGAVLTNAVFGYDGEYYFAGSDGVIAVNRWAELDGKSYFAGPAGAFYRNRFIKFGSTRYYMTADGSVAKETVFKYNGEFYYGDQTGEIAVNRWVAHKDKKFFAGPTGAFYHNRFISFGKVRYYLNTDGSVVKDLVFKCNGEFFCAEKEDGRIAIDKWVQRQDKKYFAGPTGAFYHNRYIKFGNDYYYLNTDGSVVKRNFVMNGYTVKPNPETGVVSKTDVLYSMSDRIHKGYATYVLVNISGQEMTYVRDGKYVFSSSIISGMKDKYDTPKGTYYVRYRARNVNLKGQVDEDEWDVVVDYWIAFIGNSYGFHDATWKSGFGGQTYTWNGSHGCINLPYDAARRMYNEVPNGTVVFIE